MASKQSTVDYIVDQMANAGTITSKKMFGEYGVYLDGKIFALVADDLLYVKPTAAGRALIGSPTEAPRRPTCPSVRWRRRFSRSSNLSSMRQQR